MKSTDGAQSREGKCHGLEELRKALWDRWSLVWTLKKRLDLDQMKKNCKAGW